MSINPPQVLSARAFQEWERVVAVMEEAGTIMETDATALAAYCEAYAIWSEALDKVHASGLVVKNQAGAAVRNPYLQIADNAHDQMVRLLKELGMTPNSRKAKAALLDKDERLFE